MSGSNSKSKPQRGHTGRASINYSKGTKMKILKFNTGREYSAEGQRIVAMQLDNGHVIMVDIDRHIDILFPVGVELTQTDIMQAYDHGWHVFPESIDMSYGDYYDIVRQLARV
jgi:hypothetical protein